jgi:hypothetical protein
VEEREENDLAEGEQIIPKSGGGSGVSTRCSHVFWGFKSIGRAVAPRLRMRGAITPLPYTSVWRGA